MTELRVPVGFVEALHGTYEFLRELGRGGMATVYLARDLKHDRLVALKVMHPELAATLGPERFLREIRITARLDHPHILPVLDSGEAGGFLWYTMPFVEGESLRDGLRREIQLPVDMAVDLTRQIASALEYAHHQGVVHRDLKPENILIAHGQARVADFGIAKALAGSGDGKLTETGLAVGTATYMSPEQASGGAVDARSDVYALGCVLYEMLAGEPPFTGPTPQAITMKRLVDPVPSVRRVREVVPETVEHAISRALAKVPADRFPTAGEFVQALGSAEGAPAVATLRRSEVRARTRQLMLAAVTLVAAAGAVYGLITYRSAQRAVLDPERVLVTALENRTGDGELNPVGYMAADWLTRGLLQSGAVDVVDPGALYVQSGSSGQQPTDLRQLAERNGAGLLTSGSYYLQGDSLLFQGSVLETRSGRTLLAFEPVRAPRSQPLRGVEVLQQRVIAALAGLVDTQFSAFVPAGGAATGPPTFEAYQAFVAGQNTYWGGKDNLGALAHFRRAATLDTNFLTAAVWVAVVAVPSNLCATTDSVARALASRREQLTRFDRLTLDYHLARCRGDPETVYRLARERAEAFPHSSYARFTAGHYAILARRPHEAVSWLAALSPERDLGWLPDKALYWDRLTAAYHAAGEHRAELKAAQLFAGDSSPSVPAVLFEARANAALGRSRQALKLVALASSLPRVPSYAPEMVPSDLAFEFLAHGDSMSAAVAAEQAVVALRTRLDSDSATSAEERFALARLLGLLGRDAEALPLILEAIKSDTGNVRYRGYYGVLLARRGDLAEATGEAAKLAGVEGPRLRAQQRAWRARIAAALGRREEAVELLREAFARGLPYDAELTLHATPEFQALRGYPAFEALLRGRG